MSLEIPFRFKNRFSKTTGFLPDVTGICDGEFFVQQADKAILFKDADGNLTCIPKLNTNSFVSTGQTGNFITTSQTGNFGGGNVDLSSYVTTAQTGGFALAANTGSFVTTAQTGTFITTSQTGVFALAANTGSFVTTAQTGVFALSAGTGSFVTTSQTGVFALAANTGSFVTTAQTGVFALSAGTGSFVTTAQTGVFALSADTGSFVTTSQTGVFALAANTGSFVTTTNTGSFITSCSIATGFIKNINSTSVTTPPSPQTNTAISSNVATVCGSYTTAIASQCTTLCGSYNAAIAMGGTTFSSVYGGVVNSVLSAGSTNSIYGSCSSIIAGNSNVINGPGNVITSSYLSTACITSSYSFISSSYNSFVCVTSYGSILSSTNSCIRGSSYSNLLGSSSSAICLATLSSIIGGNNNELRGTGNSILGSIFSNITGTCNSAIIGGSGNCITGLNSAGINSVILGGSAIIANCPNTAYSNNFCAFNGKYYGDASSLTGLATGNFITSSQTGVRLNNLCVNSGTFTVGAIEENIVVCNAPASGLINFDVCAAASAYYIQNSTANFYLNLRSSSEATINSILETNKTLTITFLNTNGATAYPLTGIAIDGTGRSIRWLNGNGSYPVGNASSIDTYSITAIKTGDNLYTVLGSQGKFI
jgi:hypothetical protein